MTTVTKKMVEAMEGLLNQPSVLSRRGRFACMDTYQAPPADPVALHKYLYAGADPIMNDDPSGLFFSLLDISATTYIAGQIEGSKPYQGLLEGFRGFVGMLDQRNQLMSDLLGTNSAVADTSGLDLVIGVLQGYNIAQTAILAGGALMAGFALAKLGIRVAGGVARGAFSRILQASERSLQKAFSKHSGALGLTGNWNPGRATDTMRAINQHINRPGVRAIPGKYRGEIVMHYLDPTTGVNVVSDSTGKFMAVWELNAEQLRSVLTTGRLF